MEQSQRAEFDLRAELDRTVERRRGDIRFRIVIIGLIVVFASAVLASESGNIRAGGITSKVGLGVIFLLAVFSFIVVIALQNLFSKLPGAERIVIAADGLDLIYRGGRVISLRWDDPLTKFQLADMSASNSALRAGVAYILGEQSSSGRHTVLTEEAFRAILSAAQSAGAAISSRRGGTALVYEFPQTIVYTIRGGSDLRNKSGL
jgi:hypothetical protein